jgi:hypothetical protein
VIDAPPAGLLQRFAVGRARPLPVSPGTRVEIDPNLDAAGCPCVLEEYAGGRTLMDLIRSGSLRGDVARAADVLRQVLDALDFAHGRGCVHGNLTPYCLFVDEDDRVKLEGFGLHAELEELRMEEGGDSHSVSSVHSVHTTAESLSAEKLRSLVEFAAELARVPEREKLQGRVAELLLQAFRQADRCFFVEGEGGRPATVVTKARRAADEYGARYSQNVVGKCLEDRCARLIDEPVPDDPTDPNPSIVDYHIRSVMGAPLTRADGVAFGAVPLDTRDRARKFTQEDLWLMCGFANQGRWHWRMRG